MRAVDIIVKKRDGGTLSADEIGWLIAGYVDGRVPDYQMAAWAMAVVLRGMDAAETAALTLAMAMSGETLDLHNVAPLTVDKHSTGGVGDKTTLVLGPMCAAAGLPVAKMSGRGLGFSGGTLDKLESIPGMRIDLSPEEFRRSLTTVGLVVAGQTADLAPADRLLYALRDVTGTVDSIPLIAASVMSKKLAAGADCIVLDVKSGRGAFMKTEADARALAQRMVAIGVAAGRRISAAITSMEQPLGRAIGNAVEVREAIATLQGHGALDLADLCCTLGAELALLAGHVPSIDAGRELMQNTLASGAAWAKFQAFVVAQGGDQRVLHDPQLLPTAATIETLTSAHSGYVQQVDAPTLGMIVNELGGGRQRKEDTIDPSVGIILHAKVGDRIAAGDPLLDVHAATSKAVTSVRERLQQAFVITSDTIAPPPLIIEIIRANEDTVQ